MIRYHGYLFDKNVTRILLLIFPFDKWSVLFYLKSTKHVASNKWLHSFVYVLVIYVKSRSVCLLFVKKKQKTKKKNSRVKRSLWSKNSIVFQILYIIVPFTFSNSIIIGENGVSGPWGKWSEIKLFVQIQAHCSLLITFFTIEIWPIISHISC